MGSHGMSWVYLLAPSRLRVVHEVVAGAEGATRSGQHDDMHGLIGIRPLDGRCQLARQVVVDGVENFRTVQGDAGNAPVALIEHLGHDVSLLNAAVLARFSRSLESSAQTRMP